MGKKLNGIIELGVEQIGQWPRSCRWSIIGIIFFVVVFSGYWFDTRVQLHQLSDSKQYQQRVQEQLHLNTRSIDSQKQMLANLHVKEQTLASVLHSLPKRVDVKEVLNHLQMIAEHNYLEIRLIKARKQIDYSQYSIIPIDVRVLGDYFYVTSFVSELEDYSQSLRLFTIRILPERDAVRTEQGKVTLGINQSQKLRLELNMQLFLARA